MVLIGCGASLPARESSWKVAPTIWRFMAKHRRQENTTARRLATASALAVSATVVAPAVAEAAPVVVPGTGISAEVPGVENIPGIASVPGVEQWIPSLSSQGAAQNFGANVNVPGQVSPMSSAPAQNIGEQIVNIARGKIGAPYVYGAAGPSAFDCSGFTSWVYSQVGKAIPRTSQAQVGGGTKVGYNDLQPGDIVAFYGGASHVGIYIGNGRIIDALNSNAPVAERPLSLMPFHSAVRY
ncbi:NPL/P60 family protein [Corynebacterium renale]|uniref:NlpC/P60 family protein n=2 Tax=Corynebacterium renale TaxID=1724 RepID=A0A2A9DPV2_9CORY|nr:NlpC/P60 family protein [Corynebacterium renale]SQG65032.1 NPL/P60 family protein [Corynebacterium renale]SQI18882.1 NPL/P60 family protein [Corynebacterium renale]